MMKRIVLLSAILCSVLCGCQKYESDGMYFCDLELDIYDASDADTKAVGHMSLEEKIDIDWEEGDVIYLMIGVYDNDILRVSPGSTPPAVDFHYIKGVLTNGQWVLYEAAGEHDPDSDEWHYQDFRERDYRTEPSQSIRIRSPKLSCDVSVSGQAFFVADDYFPGGLAGTETKVYLGGPAFPFEKGRKTHTIRLP